ncbi:MAG: hypothetical protein ACFFD6_12055, partial [Candidatus Thorarchaeota archaeon]
MFKNIDGASLDRLQRVARVNRLAIDVQGLSPENEADRLRAGLNGLVYSTAQDWMLPHWARLKKLKGTLPAEEVSNDQFRNWTLIGRPGGSKFATTDESGLVTVLPRCGSLDFWPQDDEGIVFPSLADRDGPRLILISPEDQLFEWNFIRGPITFSRYVYHVEENGAEAIYNEILVKNHSLNDATFVFYAAVRPMSVRGIEPIET